MEIITSTNRQKMKHQMANNQLTSPLDESSAFDNTFSPTSMLKPGVLKGSLNRNASKGSITQQYDPDTSSKFQQSHLTPRGRAIPPILNSQDYKQQMDNELISAQELAKQHKHESNVLIGVNENRRFTNLKINQQITSKAKVRHMMNNKVRLRNENQRLKTEINRSNVQDITNLRIKNERISRKLNEMLNNGLAERSYNIDPKVFKRFHENDTQKLNTINHSMLGSSKQTTDVDIMEGSARNSIQYYDKDSQKLASILQHGTSRKNLLSENMSHHKKSSSISSNAMILKGYKYIDSKRQSEMNQHNLGSILSLEQQDGVNYEDVRRNYNNSQLVYNNHRHSLDQNGNPILDKTMNKFLMYHDPLKDVIARGKNMPVINNGMLLSDRMSLNRKNSTQKINLERFMNANLEYLNLEIPGTEMINDQSQQTLMNFNQKVLEQKRIDENIDTYRRIELDDYYRWRNIQKQQKQIMEYELGIMSKEEQEMNQYLDNQMQQMFIQNLMTQRGNSSLEHLDNFQVKSQDVQQPQKKLKNRFSLSGLAQQQPKLQSHRISQAQNNQMESFLDYVENQQAFNVHSPKQRSGEIEMSMQSFDQRQNTQQRFFSHLKDRVTQKIYETPVQKRKLKELEPTSIKSKLKGRNLQTILHYNSNYKDITADRTPELLSPLSRGLPSPLGSKQLNTINFKDNRAQAASSFLNTKLLNNAVGPPSQLDTFQKTNKLAAQKKYSSVGPLTIKKEKSRLSNMTSKTKDALIKVTTQASQMSQKSQGSQKSSAGDESATASTGDMEPLTVEKIEEQIKAMSNQSANHEYVDKRQIKHLRSMNPKFFTESQLNRIWCIEQRQAMMKGSDKIIKEILQKAGSDDVGIPTLSQSNIKGKTHNIRIRNYKSNLHSIEQLVLDDMMDLRIQIHKVLNPKEAKEMNKKKRQQMKEKSIFEKTGFQLSMMTKQDIAKLIQKNKQDYIKKLIEKGSRMENSGTHGKFDDALIKKLQEDYYFKLANIIHERQQDMLIYHLDKPDYEDPPEQQKAPQSEEDEDQSDSQTEKSQVKLPLIKKKGSLIEPQDKLEKKINSNLYDKMKDAQEDIKHRMSQGILNVLKKFDRGEVSLDDLEQQNNELMAKMKKRRSLQRGVTQNDVLKELLQKEAEDIGQMDLRNNPVLKKLVMVICQQPSKEEQKGERVNRFRTIIDYLQSFQKDDEDRSFKNTSQFKVTMHKDSTASILNAISLEQQKAQAKRKSVVDPASKPLQGFQDNKSVISMDRQSFAQRIESQSIIKNQSSAHSSTVQHQSEPSIQQNNQVNLQMRNQVNVNGAQALAVKSDLMFNKYQHTIYKHHLFFSHPEALKTVDDPLSVFFKEIINKKEIDLPIFDMIMDKVLCIQNYRLSSGHCVALNEALLCLLGQKNQIISQIVLENNELRDGDLAQILMGLDNIRYIEKITIRKNQVGPVTIHNLIPLLRRRQPLNLRALTIHDCQLTPSDASELLETLVEQKKLKELTLSKIQMNNQMDKKVVYLIIQLIEETKLSKINIAWLGLDYKSFVPILDCLAENRSLSDVNLSWNRLACDKDYGKYKAEEVEAQWILAAEKIERFIKYNKELVNLDLSNCGLTRTMFNIIKKTFRKTMSLQVLNLSDNPFIVQDDEVDRLHKNIKPIMGDLDIQEISKTINMKPLDTDRVPPEIKDYHQILKPKNKQELYLMSNINKIKSHVINKIDIVDPFQNKALIFQRILGHKPEIPLAGQWEIVNNYNYYKNLLNLETNVNQKLEQGTFKHEGLPTEAVSKQNEKLKKEDKNSLDVKTKQKSCWYTDHHRYTLVFWSETIQKEVVEQDVNFQYENVSNFASKIVEGYDHEKHSLKFMNKNLLSIISSPSQSESNKRKTSQLPPRLRLKDIESSEGEDIGNQQSPGENIKAKEVGLASIQETDSMKIQQSNVTATPKKEKKKVDKNPYIYLEHNNWKPVRMIELLTFMKQIDKEPEPEPDFFKVAKKKDRIAFHLHKDDIKPHHQRIIDEEKELWIYQSKCKWDKVIQGNIRYKQPQVINANLVMESIERGEEVYVTACFLKPQKHCYLISQADEFYPKNIQCTLQTQIVGIREEPVPYFCKQGTKRDVDLERFDKDQSVFKLWSDDKPFLDIHDFPKWKVPRVMKNRDPAELEEVKQYIRDNISTLKDIFMHLQAESAGYPGIAFMVFGQFCHKSGLFDKKFGMSDADRMFISANYDPTANEGGDNSAAELIRFEFLEVLVRIVRIKYIETGICDRFVDGLKILVEDKISNYPYPRLTEWRANELWTNEVNDVFAQNSEELGYVWRKLLQEKQKKLYYDDVLNLFVRGDIQGIKLSEKSGRMCFGQSKMTVVHESYDSDKYFWMTQPEFYDFIGRVAEAKFAGTEIAEEPLAKRIEYIFDELFTWVEQERNEVIQQVVDISESDEDY